MILMTPKDVEDIAEKIADWIVKDILRVSWVDLYTGFVFGYMFAHYF